MKLSNYFWRRENSLVPVGIWTPLIQYKAESLYRPCHLNTAGPVQSRVTIPTMPFEHRWSSTKPSHYTDHAIWTPLVQYKAESLDRPCHLNTAGPVQSLITILTMPSQLNQFRVEREKWKLLYFYNFLLYEWTVFFRCVQQVLQQQKNCSTAVKQS
jgi:hypothetical protein